MQVVAFREEKDSAAGTNKIEEGGSHKLVGRIAHPFRSRRDRKRMGQPGYGQNLQETERIEGSQFANVSQIGCAGKQRRGCVAFGGDCGAAQRRQKHAL